MRFRILPSIILSTALVSGTVAVAIPGAPAGAADNSTTLTVKEGNDAVVVGKVPTTYARSLVVLDAFSGGVRHELGMGVADRSGTVRVKAHVGGDGKFTAQWRVLKNRKSVWSSPKFTLTVRDSDKSHHSLEAAILASSHAAGADSAVAQDPNAGKKEGKREVRAGRTDVSGGSPTPRSQVALTLRNDPVAPGGEEPVEVAPGGNVAEDQVADNVVKPVVNDAPEAPIVDSTKLGADAVSAASSAGEEAESTGKKALGFAKDFAGLVGDSVVAGLVGFGITELFGALLPGPDLATAAQVQALSNQVTQVQDTLNQMQATLTDLGGQVSALRGQTAQVNASSAGANCSVLLAQADGYVDTIEDYYGNYVEAYDPLWMSANLAGLSNAQAIKASGEQIFGPGPGTPSFSSGVTRLQTAVSGLAGLLSQQGRPSGAPGVVEVCSSAFSAMLASEGSANTAGTVVPLGQVENEYFSHMHSVLSYYTSWANLGQGLAARGGLLAVASLTGAESLEQTLDSCSQSSSTSPLSCSGIAARTASTIAATNAAWNSAGASWADVTNGQLLGDSRVDGTSNYIQPARAAWVKDIAMFGTSVAEIQPAITVPASTTYTLVGSESRVVGGMGINLSLDAQGQGILMIITSTAGALDASAVTASANGQSLRVTQPPWCCEAWVDVPLAPNRTSVNVVLDAGDGRGPQSLVINYQVTSTPATATPVLGTAPLTSTGPGYGPASGTTNLSDPTWLLGKSFTGAKTGNWEWAMPLQGMPAGNAGVTYGTLMSRLGLSNFGAPPRDLLLYTGQTSQFPVSQNTVLYETSYQGLTFPEQILTTASFLDTNATAQMGYSPVNGAPQGGSSLVASYVMSGAGFAQPGLNPDGTFNRRALGYQPSGNNSWCDGGYDGCDQWFSYTSQINVMGLTPPPPAQLGLNRTYNGATANATFYAPLTLAQSFHYVDRGNGGGVYGEFGNSQVIGTPGFMAQGSGAFQKQYLWPVLDLSSNPCALTSFASGVDGNAGVSNVCQDFFTLWKASALGIATGPVSVNSGLAQNTLSAAGNNAVAVTLSNASNAPQTVTVYADITSGDAQIGDVVTVVNGGTDVVDCTTYSGDLQCTITIPPGGSVLSVPVSNYTSQSTFHITLTQVSNGIVTLADSSSTSIYPRAASQDVLPAAITDLAASADGQGDQAAALTWTVPAASPPVTSYLITITDPDGSTTRVDTSTPGAPAPSGSPRAQVQVPLPNDKAGLWKFTVAAVNAGGAGPVGQAEATLGNAVPATPRNFTASEQAGGLRLDWDPVVASPALSHYTLTITRPDTGSAPGSVSTVNLNTPGYTIQAADAVGKWVFAVQAVNALGASPKAAAALNVTGLVPTRPRDVDVDVSETGWVSVAFKASESVPAATNYWIGLYAPGASQPTASLQVPVTGYSDRVRIRDFWQFGSTSQTGTWGVMITPSNAIGAGEFGAGSLYVSQQHLNNLVNRNQTQLFLQNYPTLLIQQAASACSGGFWTAAYQVFGNCYDGGNFQVDGRIPKPDVGKTSSFPTNLTASSITSTSMTISWNSPWGDGGDPIVGYQLWVNHNWTTVPAGATSVAVTGLTPNKSYFVEVQARHQSGRVSLITSKNVSTLP